MECCGWAGAWGNIECSTDVQDREESPTTGQCIECWWRERFEWAPAGE